MLVVGGCHKTQDAATGTARFWAWFQKSAPALRRERDLQRVMETISEQIEKVHPGVIAEIGSSGEDRELVISADGRRELFPVVQEIYAARPTVPRLDDLGVPSSIGSR